MRDRDALLWSCRPASTCVAEQHEIAPIADHVRRLTRRIDTLSHNNMYIGLSQYREEHKSFTDRVSLQFPTTT